ncbi:hypothetical protein FB45DRAFT_45303 [Roridomyces roridus]|uniref:Uncharacterized protein n=1 Tax=Roridomyces roridus TaxID=1738132 RepID=A0AAD7BSA2_9AGAR|nr:hypothetical protein FB45DRAFT_45303 [Roridomyces roridus]
MPSFDMPVHSLQEELKRRDQLLASAHIDKAQVKPHEVFCTKCNKSIRLGPVRYWNELWDAHRQGCDNAGGRIQEDVDDDEASGLPSEEVLALASHTDTSPSSAPPVAPYHTAAGPGVDSISSGTLPGTTTSQMTDEELELRSLLEEEQRLLYRLHRARLALRIFKASKSTRNHK